MKLLDSRARLRQLKPSVRQIQEKYHLQGNHHYLQHWSQAGAQETVVLLVASKHQISRHLRVRTLLKQVKR